eukprot:gnl/TRDRNA2_/TRDRNA2_158875_c0_seq3.p1 gnl/TRDRNA2_/TRDRNA2_158875_c0~~gnl/TRDRNA2_/TRDRNA2_158875_c0_seq3.p1  ORF type:complete len:142 (+),score=32.90 gnl/TRDRNA2_/TRDRNA2_158875_c0_seq3:60-428(+)
MVIDGNCRDTRMTMTFEIPIYSRGFHPNAGTAKKLGSIAKTVQLGCVEVHHGDVVLGDDDGVVVASLDELEEWLPKAEAIVATESAILTRIREQKRSLLDLTTYHAHVAAIKRGEESALEFG